MARGIPVDAISGTVARGRRAKTMEQVGKSEPLKHGLSGYWSRRITEEHRLVYKVTDDALMIAQLRYHY